MQERFIRCACHSPEHQIILAYDPDDQDWPELFLEVHLTTWHNPLRRFWVALRYLFGYRCAYGEWDEVVLDLDRAKDIHDFLCDFINCHTGMTIEEG